MATRYPLLVIAVLGAAALALGQNPSGEAPEYDVKAEFVERFTRFIEWPEQTWSDSGQPFVICLAGSNPFDGALASRVDSWRIKDRPVVLRQLGATPEVDGCQLLFIASDRAHALEDILAVTRDRPILTISDTAGFAERGVLINFVLAETTVAFEINPEAVDSSGLVFRAKLLMIATLVEPQDSRTGQQ